MSAAEILTWATIIALAAVTVFIGLEKNGVIENLQANASRILGPFRALPSCTFCFLSWLCFLFAIPLAATSNLFYLALPIVSAPIAKIIYENCRARQ